MNCGSTFMTVPNNGGGFRFLLMSRCSSQGPSCSGGPCAQSLPHPTPATEGSWGLWRVSRESFGETVDCSFEGVQSCPIGPPGKLWERAGAELFSVSRRLEAGIDKGVSTPAEGLKWEGCYCTLTTKPSAPAGSLKQKKCTLP